MTARPLPHSLCAGLLLVLGPFLAGGSAAAAKTDHTTYIVTLPGADAATLARVEGAGGVLVPLSMDTVYADLFAQWQLPVILVARTALGTINHSLLSLEALRSRAVPVHGVIFSGEENAASEQAICHIGQVRHLGRLPQMAVIDAQSLRNAFAANVRTELL